MRRPALSALALPSLALAALVVPACKKPTELATADRLVLVQGDAQVRQDRKSVV